ncbi:uncharacterized protein M421DRAFT_405076 [Didymella exigua CBS 183.55]|uniref:Heterokaryon incompatibility domain-containing protein n=1 Tax=Didymella exigua CBS 183.55 TaxID=1150837 RepID=A0A6A5R7N8_9PLEO|nr:uncharacterized protein M421DRAFT_405076 [Didymella exigua CBS 183.55]KAF1923762.1 hypothetical protein M421DRAFT_405076 [Didymella exigua CBS 183.55]
MGQIYSRALTVHVWLGSMSRPVSSLSSESDTPALALWRDWRQTVSEIFKGEGEPDASLDQLLFNCLVQNPYLQRAWVMQEIFLARELDIWLDMVSMGQIELRRVCRRVLNVPSIKTQTFKKPSPYLNSPMSFSRKYIASDLISLLAQFRGGACSNPLDLIFSLLSLCPTEGMQVKVDY